MLGFPSIPMYGHKMEEVRVYLIPHLITVQGDGGKPNM